ncbi:hypothetical protein TNCV_4366611 [Trichonephila clavipes]|nr:hypothetical protein TNCV_4366611 [Trichonephila clavipes]
MIDHLEDNIRRVIADIRPQMLEKVIENWTSRLDYIRASRGSPMPDIIFKISHNPSKHIIIASHIIPRSFNAVNRGSVVTGQALCLSQEDNVGRRTEVKRCALRRIVPQG